MTNPIRKFENLHILLWLIKDTCWVLEFKTLGVMSILPTLGFALYIAWRSRALPVEFMPNLAVVCWICANSVWMLGEFFFNDTLRPIAIGFFILGIAVIGFFYGRISLNKTNLN